MTWTERQAFLFWSRVHASAGCWLWRGTVASCGYGYMSFGRGSKRLVHRVMHEIMRGPIPVGLFVCHTCDVRQCVNPAHFFLGDAKANADDMIAKGRQNFAGARMQREKTHCKRGHEFTPENTRILRSGGRQCRACSVLWDRAHYQPRGKHKSGRPRKPLPLTTYDGQRRI
jgi:hypothetical protein